MSSKDNALDIVDKLEMLQKDNLDYLLITIQAGKAKDNADVWYSLKDKNAPDNLLNALFSLMSTVYDKDFLLDSLIVFCEHLDESSPKKKRKKLPGTPEDEI